MSKLLEEFAEYEIVCESGDGESIKVKNIKRIGIDSSILKECYVSRNNIENDWAWRITLKGDEKDRFCQYEKGTKEFERVLEKYLISLTLK